MLYLLLMASACQDFNMLKSEREGDDPGECSDGADNDSDTFLIAKTKTVKIHQIAVTQGCLNLLQSPVENLPLNPVESPVASPAVSLQANLLESPVGNREMSLITLRLPPPVFGSHRTRPRDGEALNCIIDVASVDPEGDVVTYTYEWLQNGQSTSIGIDRVAAGQLKNMTAGLAVSPQMMGFRMVTVERHQRLCFRIA